MQLLEERIRRDGVVKEGNVLKVDSFLNHQMDVELFDAMAEEWARLFRDCGVNKILTIEASGIGLACAVGRCMHVPVVFAKKSQSINIDGSVYSTKIRSFTHGRVYDVIVSRKYLSEGDCLLIIDDFLANGEAATGALRLLRKVHATVAGLGVLIEKSFQPGRAKLNEQGVHVYALARISKMSENYIEFIPEEA